MIRFTFSSAFSRAGFALLMLLLSACSSTAKQGTQAVPAQGQQQVFTLAKKAERSGFYQLAIDMHKSQLDKYGNNSQLNIGESRTALFWLYRKTKQFTHAMALLTDAERNLLLAQVLADPQQSQVIARRYNGLMNWRCIRAVSLLDNHDDHSADKTLVDQAWQWLNTEPVLDVKTLNPTLRHCYSLQAQLFNLRGQTDQARQLYQRLLLDDPEYWPYRYNLALSYLLQQQSDKAQALLLPGCRQTSCPLPLRQLLALSYGLQNNEQQALKWLEPLAPAEQQQHLQGYQQWRQRLGKDN